MDAITFQSWDIKNLVSEAIRDADDKLLQAAIKAGGIEFGEDHQRSWKINADVLKEKGIAPGEVTERLAAMATKLSGAATETTYARRKLAGFGRQDTNGNATIYLSEDTDRMSAALNASTNPTIRKRIAAIREAHEKYEQDEAKRKADKQQVLDELLALRAAEDAVIARRKGDPETRDSLRREALCVTHATKFMPKRNDDGSVEVTTTCMVNNNAFPRNSTHMCLNHKVAGHMYGDWSAAGYFIIAPFDDMVALNGPPAVLNTVDTYWTSGLNKALKIPNATLVLPGDVKKGLFEFDEPAHETRYKTKSFTDEDIDTIRKNLDHYNLDTFNKELAKHKGDSNATDALLAAKANVIACNATMEHLGYTVKSGGMWAWGDSRDVTEKTNKLAKKMGTVCCAHTGSEHGCLEEHAKWYIKAVEFMKRAIEMPRDKLEYERGHYKIPGERIFLSDRDYIEVLHGEYFAKLDALMEPLLAKVDENTREVYADWKKRLEPDLKRIAEYGKKACDEEAAAWRETEHGRRDGATRFINPN